MNRSGVLMVLILGTACTMCSCAVGNLIGGMAQNYEYTKLVEVHPVYSDLENKSVAVIVDVDLVTLYEHPDVAVAISANVSRRLSTNVPGIKVVSPALVSQWQFRTPQWSAMPYGEIVRKLNVDRIVHIDVHQFRLHPPGNQWLWDGLIGADVGIIERDGYDPDSYVDRFDITVAYPDMTGVTRENATARGIRTGLLTLFTRKTSWLFFTHLEPKYPDHYKGPIEEGRYDGT